ncbi:hypothetical protein [Pedobacter immunditicola]|uniref:hypothetical protein n=1 Tax=Pedobacter immunditicola TaxID=3133440 RepID=UPI0030987DB2
MENKIMITDEQLNKVEFSGIVENYRKKEENKEIKTFEQLKEKLDTNYKNLINVLDDITMKGGEYRFIKDSLDKFYSIFNDAVEFIVNQKDGHQQDSKQDLLINELQNIAIEIRNLGWKLK